MNNIKVLRVKSGMSQRELAEKLHVHQTAVSQWEKGRVNPDLQTQKNLAAFFGVTIDYLLGVSEESQKYFASNISDSNFIQGNGSVMVNETDTASKEEAELLRIYRSLDVRGRAKLLNAAFDIEDEKMLEKKDGVNAKPN